MGKSVRSERLIMGTGESMIREATTDDAAEICEIYNHYVLETSVTFEERPVTIEEMAQRIRETLRALPWLVSEENGRPIGYSYASEWKGRSAYRHSVESTVYLRPDMVGKGVGSELYAALLANLRRRQFHTVIGGLALPNPASVALHEKLGSRELLTSGRSGKSLVSGSTLDTGNSFCNFHQQPQLSPRNARLHLRQICLEKVRRTKRQITPSDSETVQSTLTLLGSVTRSSQEGIDLTLRCECPSCDRSAEQFRLKQALSV